tara:strand:+ start:120 stop:281 length:162 start_codon:yes stop_codon:yes gene_type:complete
VNADVQAALQSANKGNNAITKDVIVFSKSTATERQALAGEIHQWLIKGASSNK